MHKKYKVKFSLFCFFENMDSSFSLLLATDRFRKEFKKNSNWLKFGYHGINGHQTADELSYDRLLCNIPVFIDQMKRITGCRLTNYTRLHNYYCDEKGVALLKKYLKLKFLFVTESSAVHNYYLNSENLDFINKNNYYIDRNLKMKYIKANIRIEKSVQADLERCLNYNKIYVYTHEWCFYDNLEDIINIIEKICCYKTNTKHNFGR